jgi:hypothetical protein
MDLLIVLRNLLRGHWGQPLHATNGKSATPEQAAGTSPTASCGETDQGRFGSGNDAQGDLAALGLLDWWNTAFTPNEREYIETKYQPEGDDRYQPLTVGRPPRKLGTRTSFLIGLSNWFGSKSETGIYRKILRRILDEQAEDYETVVDDPLVLSVLHWADDQMKRGAMPRQEVVNLLQRQGPAPGPFAGHYARGIDAWPTMTGDEMQGDMKRTAATTTALQMIFEVMVVRNIEAIALEREGRQEEAMKLYEQNTADAFDGPHPYQRLLALYTASGRVEDAIRACEAFISTNLRGLRPDNAQTDHFRNAINRLRGDDCVG